MSPARDTPRNPSPEAEGGARHTMDLERENAELLDAARTAALLLDDFDDRWGALDALNAVIVKAEGR